MPPILNLCRVSGYGTETDVPGRRMQHLEQEVVAALTNLAASLPPGSARLKVTGGRHKYEGTVVELEPTKPRATRLWVHVTHAGRSINFGAGECTLFEFRDEAAEHAVAGILLALCSAVVGGQLEETHVIKSGRIVEGTSRLVLPDGERTSSMRTLFTNPFARRRVETRRYEAY